MLKKKFLSVKNDAVFHMFFADERNKDILISFLKSVLKLPDEDYNQIVITDPHLLREYEGDKLGIIDVKLRTTSGKVVHIEIQLKVPSELRDRIVFYDSKLITEQLGSGDNYEKINQVISLIITDEPLIKNSSRYYHRFTFYDANARIEFTDIIEIHTLELSKLPEAVDGTRLYDWAKFIDAEEEEEFNMVAERNPDIQEAVVRLEVLSGDERARYIAEMREKARRDMESFKKDARIEGLAEGRAEGRAEIIALMEKGLSLEEIKNMNKEKNISD